MDASRQRNLGVGMMIGGGLSMAGALIVAGHARLTITAANAADNIGIMREAWGVVAFASMAVMGGTLLLERYRRAHA